MMKTALQTLRWQKADLATCMQYATLPLSAPSADYAAANLYMWDETYHQEIAFCGARAAGRILEPDGRYRYLFPVGSGPVDEVLEAMYAEAKARDGALRLVGVSEPEMAALEAKWGENLEILETREWEDYIYSAEKLATLSGKKLHAKRNHINAYVATRDWEVVPITPEHFDICRDILEKWGEQKGDTEEETRAIERGFAAYRELGLFGILLLAQQRPVAFSVGSRVTDACFCVHFEKVVPGEQGAYALINRELVRAVCCRYPEVTLINREDDVGMENLRAAKLSYHPLYLLKKFDVTVTL